jgi:hypothetical protein
MKLELSELLKEAKADAPPPRYGVDDAVAAGRKLKARRRTLWSVGGGAALAVAVAGVVVLPQVVARQDAPATPSAAAAAAPSKAKPKAVPLTYPASRWEYAFHGYKTGKYQVSEPFLVTAGFQQATIRIGDEVEEVYGELKRPLKEGEQPKKEDYKIAYSAPGSSLLLTVYRPGAFDPALFADGTKVSVGGKSGLFKKNAHLDGDPTRKDEGHPGLAWKYAGNAWAVINTSKPNETSSKDLVAIAQGLSGAEAYPATVATKLTFVPDGYELVSGGRGADWPNGTGEFQRTNLRLVKGAEEKATGLKTPVLDDENSKVQDIRINLYRTDFSENRPPQGADQLAPYCNSGNTKLCYRMAPGGKWQVEIEGSGQEPTSELKKILAGITFASIEDGATWFPIESATP